MRVRVLLDAFDYKAGRSIIEASVPTDLSEAAIYAAEYECSKKAEEEMLVFMVIAKGCDLDMGIAPQVFLDEKLEDLDEFYVLCMSLDGLTQLLWHSPGA